MALIQDKQVGTLKLYLDKGLDPNSKPIKGTKSFAMLKPAATNQNVYDVAMALANLQKHEV
ncbi:MAG: DUF1659 domain-containing protein, partial [Clostridia bacterium]|nr:DUF1659 domain-containing protein [Clostridia bacterium]